MCLECKEWWLQQKTKVGLGRKTPGMTPGASHMHPEEKWTSLKDAQKNGSHSTFRAQLQGMNSFFISIFSWLFLY